MAVLAIAACTHESTTLRTDSTPRTEYGDQANSTQRTTNVPVTADEKVRSGNGITASDQSESEADRRITQQVRQAVVADQALSMKAKNCTIITVGGVVTLRGNVDTVNERMSIGNKASRISGVRRIDNQLEIPQ